VIKHDDSRANGQWGQTFGKIRVIHGTQKRGASVRVRAGHGGRVWNPCKKENRNHERSLDLWHCPQFREIFDWLASMMGLSSLQHHALPDKNHSERSDGVVHRGSHQTIWMVGFSPGFAPGHIPYLDDMDLHGY
jgi:hypothetical protein